MRTETSRRVFCSLANQEAWMHFISAVKNGDWPFLKVLESHMGIVFTVQMNRCPLEASPSLFEQGVAVFPVPIEEGLWSAEARHPSNHQPSWSAQLTPGTLPCLMQSSDSSRQLPRWNEKERHLCYTHLDSRGNEQNQRDGRQ